MSGSMQKKGPELIIFPPMKTVLKKRSHVVAIFADFFLLFFQYVGANLPWQDVTKCCLKLRRNERCNCKSCKNDSYFLFACQLRWFFLCTVYICRFFCFYIFQLSVLFYGFLVWCGPFLLWSLHVWLGACNRESPPKHDMTKSRSPDIHQQRGCTGRVWNELLRSAAKGWDERTRWANEMSGRWMKGAWVEQPPRANTVPKISVSITASQKHREIAVKTSRIRPRRFQEGRKHKLLTPAVLKVSNIFWN